MFSRSSEREVPPGVHPVKPPIPNGTQAPPLPGAAAPAAAAAPAKQPATPTNSVIGRDLAIIGAGLKIVSQGTLQVDGEVQGDVIGSKVIIGPSGKVTGLVNAEAIVVQGSVFGTIKGVDVRLAASSVVEGDIYHHSFTLEQGAQFEGRSRRPAEREELVPDLTTAAAPTPAV